MKPERFEEWMAGEPVRRIPPEWKPDILGAAAPAASPRHIQPAWRSLLWPSPRAWAALAAGWIVALGLNLAAAGPDLPSDAETATRNTPAATAAFAEQRRLMLELAGIIAPVPPPEQPAAPAGHTFVKPDRTWKETWT